MPRDLKRDLEMCKAVTPGPFEAVYNDSASFAVVSSESGGIALCTGSNRAVNANFVSEARTGWPEAIQRAMAAEAEVEKLRAEMHKMRETEDIRMRCLLALYCGNCETVKGILGSGETP